jgi:porphobilinogen synthase
MSFLLLERPRRNRNSEAIRSLACETRIHPGDFVAPFFILPGTGQRQLIEAMPGVERLSIDLLLKRLDNIRPLGINSIDLFPVLPPEMKDPAGSEALNPDGLLFQAIKAIKVEHPDLCVMVDVALDPYTSHGHDGVVENGKIINDATVKILADMSVLAANAGADFVAPSDMMDGRVCAIREALDIASHQDVGIMSYAAKYASAFYGPFRNALGSSPKFGDKKTYQMNPANKREALREAALDEAEGADMIMVKPALAYLDVISALKEASNLPIGAYHVSGEYAMVMAAAEKGWIDGPKVMHESLLSIKRSGADFIFSYVACSPQWLESIFLN